MCENKLGTILAIHVNATHRTHLNTIYIIVLWVQNVQHQFRIAILSPIEPNPYQVSCKSVRRCGNYFTPERQTRDIPMHRTAIILRLDAASSLCSEFAHAVPLAQFPRHSDGRPISVSTQRTHFNNIFNVFGYAQRK